MISIVIPVLDEAGNIPQLASEIFALSDHLPISEVIFVDDGSTDNTAAVVRDLQTQYPTVRLVQTGMKSGQSAAIHTGIFLATGELICTLDGDGQNPPAELVKLVAPFLNEPPLRLGLVMGQRVARQDTASKRFASKFANALRAWILQDGTRDTGCALKCFRRDAYLMLPYFNHMHRYFPALFKRDGWQVDYADVMHRARQEGVSKYTNFQRALVGIVDLLAVVWLIRRRKSAKAAAELLTE